MVTIQILGPGSLSLTSVHRLEGLFNSRIVVAFFRRPGLSLPQAHSITAHVAAYCNSCILSSSDSSSVFKIHEGGDRFICDYIPRT